MLPTRSHRAKYQRIDTHCMKCRIDEENVPRIIMECTPHQYEPEELARRLGFTVDGDSERNEKDTGSMGDRNLKDLLRRLAPVQRSCNTVICKLYEDQ